MSNKSRYFRDENTESPLEIEKHSNRLKVQKTLQQNNAQHKHMTTSRTFFAGLIRKRMKEALIDAENTGPTKQLVKDGQWCVPIDERPKNWETWPVGRPKT